MFKKGHKNKKNTFITSGSDGSFPIRLPFWMQWVTCCEKPEEAQKEKMEDFLRREFGAREVILTLREDKSLIGGFILSAGDKEFDWSLRGRYNNLRQKLTRR